MEHAWSSPKTSSAANHNFMATSGFDPVVNPLTLDPLLPHPLLSTLILLPLDPPPSSPRPPSLSPLTLEPPYLQINPPPPPTSSQPLFNTTPLSSSSITPCTPADHGRPRTRASTNLAARLPPPNKLLFSFDVGCGLLAKLLFSFDVGCGLVAKLLFACSYPRSIVQLLKAKERMAIRNGFPLMVSSRNGVGPTHQVCGLSSILMIKCAMPSSSNAKHAWSTHGHHQRRPAPPTITSWPPVASTRS